MKYFLTGLLSLLCLFSFGQNSFGVKSGVNFSTLSGETTKNKNGRESDVTSKIGFYAGGFYHYEWSEKWAIQPELLFSYQGANIEITRWEGIPVEAKGNVSMPYILLPVMLQYKPSEKIILELGPQLGLNLSKEIKIKGKVELNDQTIDLEERIKDLARFDFAVNAGVGYHLSERLIAKIRFSQGLISLDRREQEPFILYNQVFSLGVEFKL
ncbi:MAG: porin family protein [Flavobacteriaceae bacterium]|nr:porin family protein [Flavobacteriaceae bacterium]